MGLLFYQLPWRLQSLRGDAWVPPVFRLCYKPWCFVATLSWPELHLSAPASNLGAASQIPVQPSWSCHTGKVFRYLIAITVTGSWGFDATQKVLRWEEPEGVFVRGETQHPQRGEKQNSQQRVYVMDHSGKKPSDF